MDQDEEGLLGCPKIKFKATSNICSVAAMIVAATCPGRHLRVRSFKDRN